MPDARWTRCHGADLSSASRERGSLSGANLEEADRRKARLEQAAKPVPKPPAGAAASAPHFSMNNLSCCALLTTLRARGTYIVLSKWRSRRGCDEPQS